MRTPRPPAEADFTSRLRTPAIAARVGLWLGICFALAFITGLLSHVAQDPTPVFPWPTRPTWGYRVTQGLHVVSGTAAIPLLLVKLWSVFPKLFASIPIREPRKLALHGLERGSIAVLVAAAIFQLATGLANSSGWYPWGATAPIGFRFRATHYAMAWVAIGALLVHVAVKLPMIRTARGTDLESSELDRPGTAEKADTLSRRSLLRTTWLATTLAVVTTAGGTVPLLRRISIFSVRSGDGPAGIPINKSARAAGVLASATSPAFRLTVVNGTRERVLSLADLRALDQHTEELPIACVEGWSASGRWSGVRIKDLLELVDAPASSDLRVVSLQQSGAFASTHLPGHFATDDKTLLALRLEGETLSIDHGFPCRIITANRPGVLQTKWVQRLEVLT